jgi:hypothetical protein
MRWVDLLFELLDGEITLLDAELRDLDLRVEDGYIALERLALRLLLREIGLGPEDICLYLIELCLESRALLGSGLRPSRCWRKRDE